MSDSGNIAAMKLELGRQLARRGAAVVLAGRRLEIGDAEAAAIRAAGGEAEAVRLDVREADAFEAVVQDAARRYGRLDYLFNNAGVSIAGGARSERAAGIQGLVACLPELAGLRLPADLS